MPISLIIVLSIILIILNIVGLFLIKKIKIFNTSFIRFLAVGTLNTLVYFLIFTFLNIFIYYLMAHILAFLISAFVSYFLTTIYTFNNKISKETILKFPLTFLPNLILSTIGTYIVVYFDIVSDKYASLMMMIIAVPITFIVGKILLSKSK